MRWKHQPVFGAFFGMVALLAPQSVLGAEPAKSPPNGKEIPQVVTYNVEDLVLHSVTWRKGMRGEIPDGIEGVVHEIVTLVDPESWTGNETGNTIQEQNGTKLEIRATKAQHRQIVDLLAALRRLVDCAVVVDARLYEVDKDFYTKELEPVLMGGMAESGDLVTTVLERTTVAKIRKEGTPRAENKVTIPDGQESLCFSQRTAFNYRTTPDAKQAMPAYGSGLQGFSCRAAVTVSKDRRQVRIKITRNLTELINIKKDTAFDREAFDLETEKEIPVEIPNLRNSSATATVEVEDGEFALVRIPYRPATLAKDRVLVLVVRPVIYIEEEERERKKQVDPVISNNAK